MVQFKKSSEKPLISETQPYEQVENASKGQIILNNFLGGIAWAIGTIVGLSLLAVIIGLLGKNTNLIPFIGDFIAEIIKYLQLKEVIQSR